MRESCPYLGVPDSAVWKKSVASLELGVIAPLVPNARPIPQGARIAAAGSCFAQHIARFLPRWGRACMQLEPGPADWTEAERRRQSYGVFPARFGSIYSALQLVQLFERAYGRFRPVEAPWAEKDGVLDPFRPAIQPEPFPSVEAMAADRERHFAAVREMFETMDVFIFTLGLTEAWISTEDGAVFPVCPGCGGGTFDPARHRFVNFRVDEVVAHVHRFLDLLHEVNPTARMILTVSPVPLMATMEPRHVLTSTVCSKAVLRAAADEIVRDRPEVDYFPSFEIITGTFQTHAYFAQDRRTVTEQGVEHVMRVFAASYLGAPLGPTLQTSASACAEMAPLPAVCEEEIAYSDDLSNLEILTRADVEFYADGRFHVFCPPSETYYPRWMKGTWNDRAVIYAAPEAWFNALRKAAASHSLVLCLGSSQTMRCSNWPRFLWEALGPDAATRPIVLNLGMGGTTSVEFLWTLQAFLRLFNAHALPRPVSTAVLIGCTDVMYRAYALYAHVLGHTPSAMSFREKALLENAGRPDCWAMPGTFTADVLEILPAEDPDSELPLLRLPEAWHQNIATRIEIALQALEQAFAVEGLAAVLALQPVSLRAQPNDAQHRLEAEFQAQTGKNRLAWRKERGIVNHLGEYCALKVPTPPTAAFDPDPLYAFLGAHFGTAASAPTVTRLDLSDLQLFKQEGPLFEPDGVHYAMDGSKQLGRLLAVHMGLAREGSL